MAKNNSKYKTKIKEKSKPTPQESPKQLKARLQLEEAEQVKEAFIIDPKPQASTEVSKPEVKKPKVKKLAKKATVKTKKRGSISKIFREMISELKKVDWPPFKKTQHHSGVFQKTGTVLLVVLIFAVVVVAFDSGLLALLQLLTKTS